VARDQAAARSALDQIENQRAIDSAERRHDHILDPRRRSKPSADRLAQRL
jgi:hypothetical protein